jgi:dihydroorotate dehydrogenase (NAD+) catalytic subunit
MVYDIARAVRVPLVGCGGISTGEDAIEFLMAGATAVQVGTATFANPRAPLDVLDGMTAWLAANGVGDVNEIIGCARPRPD